MATSVWRSGEGAAIDAQGPLVRLAVGGVEVQQLNAQITAEREVGRLDADRRDPSLDLSTGWSWVALRAPIRTMLSQLVHSSREGTRVNALCDRPALPAVTRAACPGASRHLRRTVVTCRDGSRLVESTELAVERRLRWLAKGTDLRPLQGLTNDAPTGSSSASWRAARGRFRRSGESQVGRLPSHIREVARRLGIAVTQSERASSLLAASSPRWS